MNNLFYKSLPFSKENHVLTPSKDAQKYIYIPRYVYKYTQEQPCEEDDGGAMWEVAASARATVQVCYYFNPIHTLSFPPVSIDIPNLGQVKASS